MSCSACTTMEPIEDQGAVRIKPLRSLLRVLLEGSELPCQIESNSILVHYETKEQLLSLLQLISRLPDLYMKQLSISFIGKDRTASRTQQWMPLSHFEARLENPNLVHIICESKFTSHMQPIVSSNKDVIGYEFLLRPSPGGTSFHPLNLFEVARETGLHSFLDRASRISAIETSAQYLPRGVKRFINFLPSSIYNPEHCLSHTFEAIQRLELDAADFVFEVVETERVDDVDHLLRIFDAYRSEGMAVALDDVGSGYATLEMMKKLQPDYVKIDRSLVDGCDHRSDNQRKILTILEEAELFGAKVLAEGVERLEEFEFCRSAGVDLAQGYLFGKPMPTPLRSIAI